MADQPAPAQPAARPSFAEIAPLPKKANGKAIRDMASELPGTALIGTDLENPEIASAWMLFNNRYRSVDSSNGAFNAVDIVTGMAATQAGIARDIAADVPYGGVYTPVGTNPRAAAGSLESQTNAAQPRTLKDKIIRAFYWFSADDLLQGLVGVKRDFTLAGFSLRCKPEEGSILETLLSTGKSGIKVGAPIPPEGLDIPPEELDRFKALSEFQQNLNRATRKWEFYDLVSQLIEDWYVCDSMILFWRVDPASVKEGQAGNTGKTGANSAPTGGSKSTSTDATGKTASGEVEVPTSDPTGRDETIPGLLQICALHPALVNWDNSLGRNQLEVAIPDDLQKRISAILKLKDGQSEAIQSLLDQGVSQKYIDAVKKNQKYVQLNNKDGEYWLIKTRGRKYYGLAQPSMTSIFLPLESRKMIAEGEFTAGYMMKHFIFHVKMGESIQSGALAGQRLNWASAKETQLMSAEMAKPSKTYRMVTNHTVSFEYIFPPKEMFDPSRYEKSEQRIRNWSGITAAIHTGEGGTYGGGFLGTKKVTASLIDTRKRVDWVMTEFFDHTTIRPLIGVPDNSLVMALFDEQVLKEPKQLLDELKFIMEQGGGDPRSAERELGRDPDAIRQSKLETMLDHQQTAAYQPVYEANKKNQQVDQPNAGRPANPGTTQSEQTRNQPPASGTN